MEKIGLINVIIKKLKKIFLKKNEEKQKVKNELIYYIEKNKFKFSDLGPINIIFPKSSEELEPFLKKDFLVLIESKF